MEPVSEDRAERRNVAGRTPALDSDDVVRRWVERTCAAQGVPPKIADPDTLRDIAVLLMTGRESP